MSELESASVQSPTSRKFYPNLVPITSAMDYVWLKSSTQFISKIQITEYRSSCTHVVHVCEPLISKYIRFLLILWVTDPLM